MIWIRRALLSLPFVIAAALNVLVCFARQLNIRPERVAGYGFLFASPWAWIVDHDWFGYVHSRWFGSLITYATILWLPALMYSAVVWAVFRLFEEKRNTRFAKAR
jgi:hypothetical protein